MTAGETLIGTRIAQEVAEALTGTPPVVEIAQRLAAQYEAARAARMEQQLLAPRGLSLQSFYGAHASLNGQITLMIDQQMHHYLVLMDMEMSKMMIMRMMI